MSKKYKITIAAGLMVFALTAASIFTNKDTQVISALVTLMGGIIFAYMGGNVGEHFAQRGKRNDTPKNPGD